MTCSALQRSEVESSSLNGRIMTAYIFRYQTTV